MLSRRDKLLQQPWRDRRYNDHRHKVKLALPAIDDAPPPPRPHVTVKLKKNQKESDRKAKIESDNFSMLQRLRAIMKVNRLDNHWSKPLPKFPQKIGMYSDMESDKMNCYSEIYQLPLGNYRCYACEYAKQIKSEDQNKDDPRNIVVLPCI